MKKDWLEAALRLATDYIVESADTVFFHGRAERDDDGLFELVAKLYHEGFIRQTVSINGSASGTLEPGGTVHSYPGVAVYARRLQELNVPTMIVPPAFNTKEENDSFIGFARERGWLSAIVIAQPHQLLRIFLGYLRTMKDKQYLMALYAVCPSRVDWHREVYGSQGQKFFTRHQHIREEWKRIVAFQKKGDLASVEELLRYLNVVRCTIGK